MKKYILILAVMSLCLLTVLVACAENPVTPPEETWVCACGVGSSGKFCPECGTPKPSDTVAETDTAGVTLEETEPDTAETTPSTQASTEQATEPVTAAPRYDYFSADVKSDVTIDKSQYTGMELKLPADLQVTQADIRDYIDYLCFQKRTADNGTAQVKDQPLKWGDDAYIYYKGVIDGEAFDGGSNWDDASPYTLGLGSGAFIPGFEEGLVGVIPANATKDSPVEIKATFPEDYGNELAGKEAVFYVAVEYAVQYTLPAYTRDFVENTLLYEGKEEFYASDAAYLKEFEEYVRAYLETQLAQDLDSAKIDALWNYLTEVAVCRNHPQMELDYYYNAYVSEIEYYYDYYKSYGGAAFTEQYPTLDDFARAYVGIEKDGDWKAELTAVSRNMVTKDMIGYAIAEMEGIKTVTEEEYKAEMKYWLDYYQGYMTEEEIVAQMGENIIRASAFGEKIQKWLLEQATFVFESQAE
jgi:trigger factor